MSILIDHNTRFTEYSFEMALVILNIVPLEVRKYYVKSLSSRHLNLDMLIYLKLIKISIKQDRSLSILFCMYERCQKVPKGAKPDQKGPNKSSVFQGILFLEHIISGAHFLQGIFSLRVLSFRGTLPSGVQCLQGMLSPGANCLRGTLSAGAHCLPGHIISRGILSPGAYYLRGGLSPGHIVLEAYCLGAGCLRGGLSPGQVVSGAVCLRGILSPGHIVSRGRLSPGRIISGRIVLGHIVSGRIVSGQIVSGHHVPPPLNLRGNLLKNVLCLLGGIISKIQHIRHVLVIKLSHSTPR